MQKCSSAYDYSEDLSVFLWQLVWSSAKFDRPELLV